LKDRDSLKVQSSAEIRSEWRRFKAERKQEQASDEPSDWGD
jgi:hypothetical protein